MVALGVVITRRHGSGSCGRDECAHSGFDKRNIDRSRGRCGGESTSLGVITPTSPTNFAGISTGVLGSQHHSGQDFGQTGENGDYAVFEMELLVPSGTQSFGFDFFFLSAEYPDFVGTNYNDTFEAKVTSLAYTGNVAIDASGNDVSINSVLFAVTDPAALAGTGFVGHGGTGWLTSMSPVQEGETITLTYRVKDFGDGSYDSTALLDNFFWSTTEIDQPGVFFPPRIDYLEPKRGPIAGGQPSIIHGSRFDPSCVASIDGVESSTSYISETELQVIPETHDFGLVDVTVTCGAGLSDTLGGGYYYFDETDGEIPPSIYSLSPFMVDVAGGENVTITGDGFTADTEAYLDGALLDVNFVSDTIITIETPPHAEGLVAIGVVNPTLGLGDSIEGALMYTSYPVWPPVTDESGGGGDVALEGCACNAGAGAATWLWGLVPLLALRRRSSHEKLHGHNRVWTACRMRQ